MNVPESLGTGQAQRAVVLDAMLRISAAKGYEATTVEDVLAATGVSREAFDEMFADKSACFLEAYDGIFDTLVNYVTAAYEAEDGPWERKVTAGVRALVELLSSEADIARMAMIEAASAGDDARIRFRAALDRFAAPLEEGRKATPQGGELPPDTARFAIGGATSMIFDEVRAGRGPELKRLLPDLVFAVLMPYVGSEVAEDEMRRVTREG